jgi:hypothetical protein
MKFTITKAEIKTTQYGPLAVFETKELGNVKSFNGAILTDAEAIVAGKIALPKAVVAVTVKSKKSGRNYIALQEA